MGLTHLGLLECVVALCKCSVTLTVNPHKDHQQSVREFMAEVADRQNATSPDLCPSEVLERMQMIDTIVHLQFYPSTPIGFHEVWHYEVGLALEEALKILTGAESE